MGVFGVTDLRPAQSQKIRSDSNPMVESSIPTIQDDQRRNVDSVWVAMIRNQPPVAARHGIVWRVLHPLKKADPRKREIEDADKKRLLQMLQMSFQRRSHTPFWSSIVFVGAAAILAPLLGFIAGYIMAGLVSLSWAAIHRRRTL